MFVIKDSQLKAFREPLLKSFYKDSEQHLRMKFPVTTKKITPAEFSNIIEKGIEKAAGYNIVERADVRFFLEYMIALGPDFETNPSHDWVADIMGIRNLPGSEKIKRMLHTYPLKQES